MIKIINAYHNNLKNISLDIPLHKITGVIGVSGSGKSTLIYNILASEAQRREKIASGKASFFDIAIKAKFDEIYNLPYAVTMRQRAIKQSSSSTIATITGLYDKLREEYIKHADIISCNGLKIYKPNARDIKTFLAKFYPGENFRIFAAICCKKHTDGIKEIAFLKKHNIKEAIFISSFDDREKIRSLDGKISLNNKYMYSIFIEVEHIDKIENYEHLALDCFVAESKEHFFNFGIDYFDLTDGSLYQKITESLLSFNSTSKLSGRCLECNGKGHIKEIDKYQLIDFTKPISDISFLRLQRNAKGYKYTPLSHSKIISKCKHENVNTTFDKLSETLQDSLLKEIKEKLVGKEQMDGFFTTEICPVCQGTRLNSKARAAKLYGKNISEITHLSIDELYEFIKNKPICNEILHILLALKTSTLGYLSLERNTDSLSGGELQRLKLARELHSPYKNLLYIFDEPSNGLHPYNNRQIISLLSNLKNKGNTIIISEHNEDYMRACDYIVELGNGSGKNGGNVVFCGNYKDKMQETLSFSREQKKPLKWEFLEFINVNFRNIQNQDFKIPLHCLVAISGVSGSGKSTFTHVLVSVIKHFLEHGMIDNRKLDDVKNIKKIDALMEFTQSSIGNNSRSIVATYLGIFDFIRETFASIALDKEYFSFNTKGACEQCRGLGEIEHQTDSIICPSCQGKKYKAEVLNVFYKGVNIDYVLNADIESLEFESMKIKNILIILKDLGLSHLSLGRATQTLSGGEAQRLRLAKALIENEKKINNGGCLLVLDEPSNALSKKDFIRLLSLFYKIIGKGNSIIMIEHNQDMIINSDYIIDIGIGAGSNGGKNIFSGSVEELLKSDVSLTAKAFNKEYAPYIDIPLQSDLQDKHYDYNICLYPYHSFYLSQKHFKVEKDFLGNCVVVTETKNHKYFKNFNDLALFVNQFSNYQLSFNPYTNFLYNYKKVPLSYKKNRLKELQKLHFMIRNGDEYINEWEYRVVCNDLLSAYNFGAGWVTLCVKGEYFELFTRLILPKENIVGQPCITQESFSLYYNSCPYCDGSGTIQSCIIESFITDNSKSIIDSDFFNFKKKILSKQTISTFNKEQLFDFTKPYNTFSEDDKNIFLFGFKAYKFLKPKGNPNTLSDYFEWKGMLHYLAEIPSLDYIQQRCPFCLQGFKKEVGFYKVQDKSIIDVYSNFNAESLIKIF